MSARVLICRPQPGADETAQRARALGLTPVLTPLSVVEPIDWTPPEAARFDTLLLTSANSLRHGGSGIDRYRALPAYAVGEATAAAARARGFERVIVGGGNAQTTIDRIARLGGQAVLHLCGTDVRPYDAGTLSVERIAVYETRDRHDATSFAAALRSCDAVLAHSPRGAARVRDLSAEEDRRTVVLVAISAAAAQTAGAGWKSAVFPDRPDDAAMLALAVQMCQHRGE